MKRLVGIVLLALAACGPSADEGAGEPDDRAPAESVVPPGKTEPARLGETRTFLLPAWEVYEMPHTRGTDAPALAVPKDGRGVPLVLWVGWYRKVGDAYFRTMLHSGYLSLLDLEVIGAGLEEPLRWEGPAPDDAVDPFEDRVAVPEDLSPGDNEVPARPRRADVGSASDGDGEHTSAIAEYLRRPPRGVRQSGGARPGGDQGGILPSFDTTAGPAKLRQALAHFLTADVVRAFAGDRDACEETCSGGRPVLASDARACETVPELRAIPDTVVPCASIAAASSRVGVATAWCRLQCEAVWSGVK